MRLLALFLLLGILACGGETPPTPDPQDDPSKSPDPFDELEAWFDAPQGEGPHGDALLRRISACQGNRHDHHSRCGQCRCAVGANSQLSTRAQVAHIALPLARGT